MGLLQLYSYYKGWSNTINNPRYSYDAHHAYIVENYVESIASAVRELDGNRYPLSHYMAYGWVGLEESGYLAERLTPSQDAHNKNLRTIVENNFNEICN